MYAASKIARRWKPIVLTVLLGALETFFINKVSGDSPSWWWWLLLVATLIGAMGCAFWALFIQTDEGEVAPGGSRIAGSGNTSNGVTQQSTSTTGRNVSVSANDGSFAAYRVEKIRDLNIGESRRRTDPEEPRQP